MDPTRLILVGGFLGAGKTSLLMSAAELLKKRGRYYNLYMLQYDEEKIKNQA